MSFTPVHFVLDPPPLYRFIELESHPSLPDGKYEFLESYCTEPTCDCCKTILEIKHNGQSVGSVDYGWETLKFYKKWALGDSEMAREMVGVNINPFAEFKLNCNELLDLIEDLMDKKWTNTIKQNYRKFRREIKSQHAQSKLVLTSKEPSRNASCPCGSGKKYKRCCINETFTDNSQNIISFPDRESEQVENKVDQALDCIGRKDFKKAKRILSPLVKNHPHQASVHFGMGSYHGRRDESTEAIPYFEEAVNLLPNFIEAWHNLGQAYRLNFKIREAVHAARKVIKYAENDQHDQEIAQQNQDFINTLAESIMEHDGLELDDYMIVLETFDAAFLKMLNGDYNAAIEGFKEVLKSTPKNSQTHGNIATCYANLGDKTKALYHIEKSLEIDPSYQVAIDNKIIYEKMTDGQPLNLPCQTVNYNATGLKPI